MSGKMDVEREVKSPIGRRETVWTDLAVGRELKLHLAVRAYVDINITC